MKIDKLILAVMIFLLAVMICWALGHFLWHPFHQMMHTYSLEEYEKNNRLMEAAAGFTLLFFAVVPIVIISGIYHALTDR